MQPVETVGAPDYAENVGDVVEKLGPLGAEQAVADVGIHAVSAPAHHALYRNCHAPLDSGEGLMSDTEKSPATLLDELARLDPQERREVAAIARRLSENLAEVSDGKTTSHVLGVLAHLLDPS